MNTTFLPRIVLFQCQFCLPSEADQRWVEGHLPENIKLIQTSCTGRISPLLVLNAVQSGADGIFINGCMPGKCHFKEGNLGARRLLDEFFRFLAYLGMEEERVRFAWMELTERGHIQKEMEAFQEAIQAIGPARHLVTRPAQAGVSLPMQKKESALGERAPSCEGGRPALHPSDTWGVQREELPDSWGMPLPQQEVQQEASQ